MNSEKEEKLNDRIADYNLIKQVVGERILIREGAGIKIGEVERIIFRDIISTESFGPGSMPYITGHIEFYYQDRCFFLKSNKRLDNTFQFVKEKENDYPFRYSVGVGAFNLTKIYEISEQYTNQSLSQL